MHRNVESKSTLASSFHDLQVFTPEPRSKKRNILKNFILSSALVSQKMCTKHTPDLESGRGIQPVISLEYQFGK